MNNLKPLPMQANLPIAACEDGRELLKLTDGPSRSLYYSALFSVLSPISAIGVLELLNHFLIQP